MVPVKSSAAKKTTAGARKKNSKKTDSPAKKSSSRGTTKASKKTKLSVRVVSKKLDVKNSKDEEAIFDKVKKPPVLHDSSFVEKNKNISAKTIKKDFSKRIILDDKKDKKNIAKKDRPSPGLYRNIALSFLFLTAILLVAVFYFYCMILTVEIYPQKEVVKGKVSFFVLDEKKNLAETSENKILGAVESLDARKENIYTSSGEEILGHEIIGEVTLINNTSEDRPLVATTRLLTPDGKLFRLTNRVTVPANGSTKAEIYTDEPGPEMAVAPGTFTIPGLWAGLQDKVYAKNESAFVYRQETKRMIKQSDIDDAVAKIKKSLTAEVQEKLGNDYKGFDEVVIKPVETSLKIDVGAKAGDELENFKVSASMRVEIVAFSRVAAYNLASKKFSSTLLNDKKASSLDENSIEYNLTNVDFDKGEAEIELMFSGYTIPKNAANILDKKKLIGLSGDQAEEYIKDLGNFSDFKLVFWPSFIKKAPMLTDRIRVEIKE